jgi:hypothetical protein
MVAVCLRRVGEPALADYAARVRSCAIALARGEQVVEGLVLLDVVDPPGPRLTLEIVRSSVGPVPRLQDLAPAGFGLADCTESLLAAVAAPLSGDERIALVLTLEGTLGWYQHSDASFQPAQQAVAYALRHAAARLREGGQPVPDSLAAAIDAHRVIPLAGG